MLVLTRRIGEEIVIADDIRVTVIAISGNSVRLGFTAPPDVTIYREELLRDRKPVGAGLTERHDVAAH
ncbi:MAG: carbon storage regulator CsrA [Gemmataceae bacterium]|nr:carbon storage regulator CsrA [Gemmataceae bacterium]